jgi:hypothetical protein
MSYTLPCNFVLVTQFREFGALWYRIREVGSLRGIEL